MASFLIEIHSHCQVWRHPLLADFPLRSCIRLANCDMFVTVEDHVCGFIQRNASRWSCSTASSTFSVINAWLGSSIFGLRFLTTKCWRGDRMRAAWFAEALILIVWSEWIRNPLWNQNGNEEKWSFFKHSFEWRARTFLRHFWLSVSLNVSCANEEKKTTECTLETEPNSTTVYFHQQNSM